MNFTKRTAAGAVLGLALSLAACTGPTPYQPNLAGQRVSGGYSDVRIAPDRYRISFAGNNLTSRDRVEGYLLYRAAELTLQSGYDSFVILDRLTERDQRTYVRPDPFYRPYYGMGYGYWRPHWRYYRRGFGWDSWYPYYGSPFWADRIDLRTVQRFEAHAEIQLRRGMPAAGEERVFDARRVIQDLEPMIERPRA
jgi:hypothetical protein